MILSQATSHEQRTTSSDELVSLAYRTLRASYLPERHEFAFRLQRCPKGIEIEGSSIRYTAVALLGLAHASPEVSDDILAGENSLDLCGQLLARLYASVDLGEVALTLWAARELNHSDTNCALRRLADMDPARGPYPTVESAWALSALCGSGETPCSALMTELADRIMSAFCGQSNLFAHYPPGVARRSLRGHICCFADLVYPIQALARYYRLSNDTRALSIARRCARRICELQGPQGQWWWHYDLRTGRVVERFPVYAVHQDAMGPMALLELRESGGEDYSDAIEKSLQWLADSPEIRGSLIDTDNQVIWRKVARREPGKFTRSLQAAASRTHPALRMPAMDVLFPPVRIDYETRPYHAGWILYTWSRRLRQAADSR